MCVNEWMMKSEMKQLNDDRDIRMCIMMSLCDGRHSRYPNMITLSVITYLMILILAPCMQGWYPWACVW